MNMYGHFNGLQIFVTMDAIRKGKRLFPESKHRSRRIYKKLLKRFGGTHELIPCALVVGDKAFVHPTIYEELKRRTTNE